MTTVLSTLAMTPQLGQASFGATIDDAMGDAGGFEALLAGSPDGSELHDEEGTTWVRPLDVPETESEPLRGQGPQLPREEDVWPTAAMPVRPPLDGQALTASAPAAPEGRPARVVLDPMGPGSNVPLPPEWAPIARPDELPADLLRALPDTNQGPFEPVAPEPVVARSVAFEGVALEPIDVTPLPELVTTRSPDAENRPVVVRMASNAPVPAEPTPVPESMLPARIDPNGALRVELDADLALEVKPVARGVEVTLDGTPQALQPMEGIEQELDAALDDAGSHLSEFQQRRRPARSQFRSDSDEDGGMPAVTDDAEPVQVRAGASLIHVVA